MGHWSDEDRLTAREHWQLQRSRSVESVTSEPKVIDGILYFPDGSSINITERNFDALLQLDEEVVDQIAQFQLGSGTAQHGEIWSAADGQNFRLTHSSSRGWHWEKLQMPVQRQLEVQLPREDDSPRQRQLPMFGATGTEG